nr:hypothetical protein BaRGS_018241 [Batillaria attramentaria]
MNVKPAHRRTDSTATADPQNNNNNPQYYYNRSLPQPQKNPPPRKTVVEKNPEDGAKTQPKKRVTIKEDKDKNTNVSQNGKVKTNDKATPPKKTENKTTKKTQNTVKISVNGTDGKKKTEKAGEKKTEKAGEKKAPKPKPSPATPRRNVETARSEETPRRTAPMSRGGYSVQDSYISDEEDVEG